jgi:Protein of unknown function (DUF3306)
VSDDKEDFLRRWSRRKKEAAVEKPPETPKPNLPPVDQLTPESDYSGFMHPKVEDALRRVALKKLFRGDPHFNLPDPFEAYSGDWTGGEPISEEMLATLNQAKQLIFSEEEKKEEVAAQDKPEDKKAEEEAKPDEPGKQSA